MVLRTSTKNEMVWTCRAQHRLDFRSSKLNVVAQKRRSGRLRKSWDEVIKNDRKKLDMDSAVLPSESF